MDETRVLEEDPLEMDEASEEVSVDKVGMKEALEEGVGLEEEVMVIEGGVGRKGWVGRRAVPAPW